MSKKAIYLAIQNGFWLIEPNAAASLGESVRNFLAGGNFWKDLDKAKSNDLLENSILLIGSGRDPYQAADTKFSNATPGSIAMITISGPIMKEDNCGDPGTKTYESLIQSADRNPNVDAIILQIDSPGGTVDGTQSLANVVRSATKPVVTFIDGMMASAAYWIGSSANHIMANTATCMIGSIGTMVSFTDMQKYWEAQGIKFHNINADASVDKNAAFAEARAGNYDKIKKEMLNPLNDQFISQVKENRSGKFDTEKENIFTGKVYVAAAAVKNGLIDSIGNLNNAIEKAFELAGNPPQNQSNTHMSKIKLAAFASIGFVLAAAGFTKPEEIETLGEDHLKAIEDKLSADTTKITELNAAVTTASEKAAADLAKITSLEKDLLEAKEEVTKLKSSNPGATATKSEGAEKTGEEEENEYETDADRNLKAIKAKVGDTYK